MSGEEDNNADRKETRRSLLRKIGAASAVGAVGIGGVGSSLLSSPASASSNCHSGSANEGTLCEVDPANFLTSYTIDPWCANGEFQVATKASASILYLGSSPPDKEEGQYQWEHYFASGGRGRTLYRDAERENASDCYGSWSLEQNMKYHEMFLANNPNGSNGHEDNSLSTPEGGNDIGADPNPNYTNDPTLGNVLFTSLTEVVSVMDPLADRLSTAYGIASSMYGAPDDGYNNTDTYKWEYSYGNIPSEVSHTAMFNVTSDDRKTCRIYGYNEFQSSDQYGTYVSLSWSVDVTDGDSNQSTISSSPARTEATPSPDDVGRPEWFPEDRVIDRVKVDKKSSKGRGDLHIPSAGISENSKLAKLDNGQGVALKRFPSDIKTVMYMGHTE